MGQMKCVVVAAVILAALAVSPAWASEPARPNAPAAQGASCQKPAALPDEVLLRAGRKPTGYDRDYPFIAYSDAPVRNPVARLQERLDRGEIKLQYERERGYFDSLLKALGIDPSSQVLVYSKSSLQAPLIGPETPRALYFNDDTYIAWVQSSHIVEVATMDCDKGAVFYLFDNRQNTPQPFERESMQCLSCHDTFSMTGGGVPRFMVNSVPVDTKGVAFRTETAIDVNDSTPLEQRWGGWYVTGQHGRQKHLGNILTDSIEAFRQVDFSRTGNRDTLTGLFDTRPYLTDKSDIVALLVFEHQAHLQNLLTRANFKARGALIKVMGESALDRPWDELTPPLQTGFKRLLESVVRSMVFADAITFSDKIRGSSGFDAWFQTQGPRDPQGRSLRELELNTRLFRYPLSYLVYSEAFDGLPRSARDYIYSRLAEILQGRDNALSAKLSPADREAALEILRATKPEFVAHEKDAA
jgi:hypothetical protein